MAEDRRLASKGVHVEPYHNRRTWLHSIPLGQPCGPLSRCRSAIWGAREIVKLTSLASPASSRTQEMNCDSLAQVPLALRSCLPHHRQGECHAVEGRWCTHYCKVSGLQRFSPRVRKGAPIHLG
jgi:hypothetical protein